MSLWRQLARGARVLANRDAADQEIAEELQHYYDQTVAAGVARGLSLDEARRAAQAEFGSMTAAREKVRGYGWENAVDTAIADLRYAARRLRASPGFTVVTVLTLGVAMGATTAIFSAVNPILFEPLPYPRPERILLISDVGSGNALSAPTFGTYEELVRRSRSFDALAATNDLPVALTGNSEPERVLAQQVSAPYFRVWGVPLETGRDFTPSEDVPNGPRVAILTSRLAQRRFGGEHAAVGQALMLDGDPYTVVGVTPPGFESVLAPTAELWIPLQYRSHAPPQSKEWGHHLHILGRLKAGILADQARLELMAIARTPAAEFPRPPWADLARGFIVHPLQLEVTSDARPALLAILGAVFLVLAIAGVNVTNLLLARGAQRGGEFAMRVALGAGPARLIRQLLTESLLLALLAGGMGLGVAALGVRAVVALSPPGLPRADAIRLDAASFAFALGVSTLVGLSVGLAPALAASRRDLQASLHEGSRRAAGRHQSLRRGLVIAEVALALMLLVSTGLLLRSLAGLFTVAPGFDASHMITMQVEAAGHQYDADDARYRFFTQALDAVRAVPGVTAAAFTSQLPLSGDHDGYGVTAQTTSGSGANDTLNALRYAVTPGYLEAMRIPLRRGRLFDARDVMTMPEVILISASLAARQFPGVDPIGQRIKAGPEFGRVDRPWGTVVGVVADVKQDSLTAGQASEFYVPMGQWSWVDNAQSLVVRTSGDPTALVPALKRAIWSVDKGQPIDRIATMDHFVAASAAERRFALTLFEAFGGVALLLAAIGIYGVLSGTVTERTREIGVRSALGASRGTILVLIGREGMTLTGLGAIVGLAGAVAASRAIATLLYGVTALDPITYLGMIALLVMVSAIACWLPARRAARMDPAATLRLE